MHACINAWTRENRDERKQRRLEDKMTKKKFWKKCQGKKESSHVVFKFTNLKGLNWALM